MLLILRLLQAWGWAGLFSPPLSDVQDHCSPPLLSQRLPTASMPHQSETYESHKMWTAWRARETRGQMAVTNSETLPEKPSLSSLRHPLPTVQQGHKGRNCEATNKKATSRDDVSSLSARTNTMAPSRLISGVRHPRKRKHEFFPPQTAPKVPTISFHGWILKERRYRPFIHSFLCLRSDAKG